MKVQCKHCLPEEGIAIPDFTTAEKKALMELKLHSPLQAIKFLIDTFKVSHLNAKYITLHINKKQGCCNRYTFNNLKEEYATCPNCGALSFNWRI